jgi:hypothetical protein
MTTNFGGSGPARRPRRRIQNTVLFSAGLDPTKPAPLTVEFFNLVLELKLTKEETSDLAAFLRCL